jgi:hypothetical protein
VQGLQAAMVHIRAKFRQCAALLRTNQRYDTAVQPGPASNLGF